MSDEVSITDDGRVRVITLHRPESKNGLTLATTTELADALDGAGRDDAIRTVVLFGKGGAFCSGLDLKSAITAGQGGGDAASIRDRMQKHFHRMIRSIRNLAKPVIAIVDGAAAGFGCDLALACDLRIGSARARFGEIFVKRGLIPDGGGSFTLPRLVGVGKALELMLTGDIVGADESHRLGLLNQLIPDGDDVYAAGLALAHKIAGGPPMVLALVKQLVYGNLEGTFDQALNAELEAQIRCLQSQDFIEGMSAFFGKRAPDFKGR